MNQRTKIKNINIFIIKRIQKKIRKVYVKVNLVLLYYKQFNQNKK